MLLAPKGRDPSTQYSAEAPWCNLAVQFVFTKGRPHADGDEAARTSWETMGVRQLCETARYFCRGFVQDQPRYELGLKLSEIARYWMRTMTFLVQPGLADARVFNCGLCFNI